MAVIFMYTASLTGENQELIEGITMLIAVAVMFYVSNWIFSKSETAAWEGYIKKRVNTSIQKSSAFSLAFTAFLAVFREGAEIILFYQALLAGDNTNIGMIWLGLGVGVVILAGIYLLIRFLSIKVPLKPFFRATSVLMFLMVVSFMGNAVKEFQEGNYVSVTSIKGMFTFDILGIYPTYETLIPQLLLLLISAAAIIFQIFRLRKLKSAARIAASADGGENPAAPDAESAGDNTAENTSFDKESEVTDANISIPDRESGTEEHIE
jgi:high-affinity iron transporter